VVVLLQTDGAHKAGSWGSGSSSAGLVALFSAARVKVFRGAMDTWKVRDWGGVLKVRDWCGVLEGARLVWAPVRYAVGVGSSPSGGSLHSLWLSGFG